MASFSHAHDSSNRQACPCKNLPLALSSFTAAEYGNTHILAKKLKQSESSIDVNRVSDAGHINLLHLTVQNGHVSATAMLLQLGAHVDGTPKSQGGCGATPLHRAAFSGAVSTARMLLDWSSRSSLSFSKCDLLAKDTSFGDEMTPLHKAISGGRYLSVQLLIETFRNDRSENADSIDSSSQQIVEASKIDNSKHLQGVTNLRNKPTQTSRILSRALCALDSRGRTPLDLAREMLPRESTEVNNVARWDAVAGGRADWGRCLELLLAAAAEVDAEAQKESVQKSKQSTAIATNEFVCKASDIPAPIPWYLTTIHSCLDCGSDGGKILPWEAAFRNALCANVTSTLKSHNENVRSDGNQINYTKIKSSLSEVVTSNTHNENASRKGESHERLSSVFVDQNETNKTNKKEASLHTHSSKKSTVAPMSQHCTSCKNLCLALFRGKNGMLVCRKCRRRQK